MRKSILLFCCVTLLMTSACSSNKFIVSSYPEGAYIVGYGETGQDQSIEGTYMFMGKSDSYDFIAMKRGYLSDTVTVTKSSPSEVHIELKPMEGIPPLIRKPMELDMKNANLLPVNVEIVLHKGVGNLDKYVKSDELSKEARLEMNQELQDIQSDTSICMLSITEHPDWPAASSELEAYLQSLSTELLPYYPEAPSVSRIFAKYPQLFASIQDLLKQPREAELIVYAWCKSVKPTTGRIIGNISATVAGGVVSGYETAMYGYPVTYSDPSAFRLDNSTIFAAYIIDPVSGEIIDTRQFVVPYDITKTDRVHMLAKSIIMFPRAKSNSD
ncbi:MAG: hypothetical protein GY790_07765 [Bacteroidetes bacterium]|nr:hypothetical protein [Bacteroidota bacterium]